MDYCERKMYTMYVSNMKMDTTEIRLFRLFRQI